ncbi:MAG: hypothetical protein RR697_03855, partial [Malacoplasma sp.]
RHSNVLQSTYTYPHFCISFIYKITMASIYSYSLYLLVICVFINKHLQIIFHLNFFFLFFFIDANKKEPFNLTTLSRKIIYP